jgi:hypothetical protein
MWWLRGLVRVDISARVYGMSVFCSVCAVVFTALLGFVLVWTCIANVKD